MSASYSGTNQFSKMVSTVRYPAAGFPMCVAFLCYPFSMAPTNQIIWSWSNSTSSSNWMRVGLDSSGRIVAAAQSGVSSVAAFGSPSGISANQWIFGLGRFISSTNRWVQGALFDSPDGGAVVSGQSSTTVAAPTGMDSNYLAAQEISSGPTNFFGGLIAEIWWLNGDVYGADPAASLNSAVVRELAQNGPFSIPSIANNLIEYRSLRSGGDSSWDRIRAIYCPFGESKWIDIAGVSFNQVAPITPGWNPPLPMSFARPNQMKPVRII